MTSIQTEDLLITELDAEIQLPCDYYGDGTCQDLPAKWVMFKHCPECDERGAKLVCTSCKDARMTSEAGLVCLPGCGEVVAPARHMYSGVEAL